MSTMTISRPTTTEDRKRFSSLTADQRVAVVSAARSYAAKCSSPKEAWGKAFASLLAERSHGGGMPKGHTFVRAAGHRLVALRRTTGECSCGVKYVGTDPADVRNAHSSHKSEL